MLKVNENEPNTVPNTAHLMMLRKQNTNACYPESNANVYLGIQGTQIVLDGDPPSGDAAKKFTFALPLKKEPEDCLRDCRGGRYTYELLLFSVCFCRLKWYPIGAFHFITTQRKNC